MRKKLFVFMVLFLLVIPIGSWSADTKNGEKEMFGEVKKLIPAAMRPMTGKEILFPSQSNYSCTN